MKHIKKRVKAMKKKTVSIFAIMALFSVVPLFADDVTINEPLKNDGPKDNLRLEILTPAVSLSVSDKKNSSYALDLFNDPSSPPFEVGFQYSYDFFSIGYATNFSSNTNIFGSLFFNRWGAELFFQDYNNFYISNSDDSGKKYPGPNEYEKLKVVDAGCSFFYFFRDNTYKDDFYPSEKKPECGWAPFVKITPKLFSFKNNAPLVPEADRSRFGSAGNMSWGDFYQLSSSAGITCTLAYNGFYFSPLINLGWVEGVGRYGGPNQSVKSSWSGAIDFGFHFIIGYRNDAINAGMWCLNESGWGQMGSMTVQVLCLQAGYFCGMVF